MNLFYSHLSRQKPLVRELSARLGNKIDAWVDEDSIKLGDGIGLRLASAINDEVDIFVLLLCRDASNSDWVRKEVAYAQEREVRTKEKFLFAIVIDEDVLNENHWAFLKDKKYLKLNGYEAVDIAAVAEKLRGEIFDWLIHQHKVSKQPPEPSPDRADSKNFSKWLKVDALGELLVELDETIVDRKLTDVFVCPPLIELGDVEDASEGSLRPKSRSVKLEEVISGPENWVIFVPPEFGQTSLARHISYQSLVDADKLDVPRLPTIVDASRWQRSKPYDADFFRILRRGSPDNLPKKREELLAKGEQFIIVENLDLANVELITYLDQFARKYKSCKFVYLVRTPLVGPPPANLALSIGVDYRSLYVGVFDRSHVRKFIVKWGVPQGFDVEQLVNTTIDRFSQLNVPICALNLTFYMYVLEQANDFAPINLSVLLEMFIEAVLEKNDPKMIFRSQFDFTNKVDFLAHIASRMALGDEYCMTTTGFEDAAKKYFEGLEVDQRASEILDYFCKTQILLSVDGVVSFKYTIFFSFFAAKAMVASEEFRSFILQEDNCTRYLTELDIYFGSVRNDAASLNLLADYHARADLALDECLRQAGISVDTGFVETLVLDQNNKNKVSMSSVVKRIANGGAQTDERDRELSNPMEKRIGLLQEIKRPKFRDAVARWILTLRLYSVGVKNMELIPGAEKRRHLGTLFRSWGKATAAGLVLVEGLGRDGYLTIGNITIFVSEETQKRMKKRGMRPYYLAVPHAIADYMRRDLGTTKLSRLLADGSVVNGELLPEFLQKILGSDLRIPGYLDGISDVSKKLSDSPYLREALLWHLWRVYFSRILKPDEESKFIEVVSELYLDLRRYVGPQRAREKSKILQQIQKDKLITKLSSN